MPVNTKGLPRMDFHAYSVILMAAFHEGFINSNATGKGSLPEAMLILVQTVRTMMLQESEPE